MNTFIQIGSTIVVLALISYSVGVISEQRTKILSKKAVFMITLGVILDITATIYMIIGSSKSGITLHGVIGYSSLAGMLLDSIFIWNRVLKTSFNTEVPLKLHRYTRYAYLWWVTAFITGGLLVFLER